MAVKSTKEEKVTIKIPRESKTQEDKVVWVNDRRYVIKRGIPVDVPVAVAEVLAQEEQLLQQAYEFETRVQK